MKGIITVVGKDKVGIIAEVCSYLARTNINILDISQSIVGGFFNMMVIADLSKSDKPLDVLVKDLRILGNSMNVDIRIQHEDIFDAVHRI